MRSAVLCLVAILGAMRLGSAEARIPHDRAQFRADRIEHFCLVVGVGDGDTLTARCGEPGAYEQVKIRISAIDAPEKAQPFGQVSRQHLAKLCFKQQATITPKTKDRYGRTVADVECQGQDAATEQVRSGLAWYYVRYGKGYEHLQGLQDEAQAALRGLWSVQAVAPWEWRRDAKKASAGAAHFLHTKPKLLPQPNFSMLSTDLSTAFF